MSEYDLLDLKAEADDLYEEDHARMKVISREMQRLWLKEETKAKQCSERDRNTTLANQHRRKMMILSLDGPNGQTIDIEEMLDTSSFYKDLFCSYDRSCIFLREDLFSPEELVSEEQNAAME